VELQKKLGISQNKIGSALAKKSTSKNKKAVVNSKETTTWRLS
jgi:hypothetical protein